MDISTEELDQILNHLTDTDIPHEFRELVGKLVRVHLEREELFSECFSFAEDYGVKMPNLKSVLGINSADTE